MYLNYFKIAIRTLLRNKFYTLICMLGLSLGIACSLLLYLYMVDELSYDRFLNGSSDIYTVKTHYTEDGETESFIYTPGAMAEAMKNDYPEVQAAVRLRLSGSNLLEYQDQKIRTQITYYTDPAFFEVMPYPFLCGTPEKALQEPNQVVLTHETAKKLFGQACNALSQSIRIDDESFKISGVMEDLPSTTSFPFEAIMSIKSIPEDRLQNMGAAGWQGIGCQTMIRLHPGNDPKLVSQKMQGIQKKYFQEMSEEQGYDMAMELVSLRDVRLYEEGNGEQGTMTYIYVLSIIAFILLLLGTINYINLATARAMNRAREVGIRKVVGSLRGQLIGQFLSESLVLVFLSLLISFFFIQLALPFFNQIASKNLSMNTLWTLPGLGATVLLCAVLTLLSGFYPSWVLSSFNPVLVLKGKFSSSPQGIRFRKALVIFQFTVSVVLITATSVVYYQMQYIFQLDLGYDREQIVIMHLNKATAPKGAIIRQKLLENANIQSAALSNLVPSYNSWAHNPWKGENDQGDEILLSADIAPVGYDFVEVMGIEMASGRPFSPQFPTDSTQSVIVNESFVEKMGWKDPIGQEVWSGMGSGSQRYKVIGVAQDFHIFSLHQAIEPTLLKFSARPYNIITKINTQNLPATLEYMQSVWNDFEPRYTFEPVFLDQAFAEQYAKEEREGKIFLIFSAMAIFIACLGLFGLSTYTVQLKSKEIGIRKVLGASVPQILTLLSRNFIQLVAIASLLGIPFAYWISKQWLQNFVYRIELLSIWYVFFMAGLLTLLLSLITIASQTYRAALTNPIEVLRDE